MTMQRRGFLGAMLAAATAPAFVKAGVLMPVQRIWTPPAGIILGGAIEAEMRFLDAAGMLLASSKMKGAAPDQAKRGEIRAYFTGSAYADRTGDIAICELIGPWGTHRERGADIIRSGGTTLIAGDQIYMAGMPVDLKC